MNKCNVLIFCLHWIINILRLIYQEENKYNVQIQNAYMQNPDILSYSFHNRLKNHKTSGSLTYFTSIKYYDKHVLLATRISREGMKIYRYKIYFQLIMNTRKLKIAEKIVPPFIMHNAKFGSHENYPLYGTSSHWVFCVLVCQVLHVAIFLWFHGCICGS